MNKVEVRTNKEHKMLLLDGVVQGVSDHTGYPVSPYMLPIMRHIKLLFASSKCLFLGGGAMLLPSFAKSQSMDVVVLENNQEIIEAARGSFGFNMNEVYFVDASKLDYAIVDKHDFILLDCYPKTEYLYSKEYAEVCKTKLRDKGTFCVNYCEEDTDKATKYAKDLANVFGNVKAVTFYTSKDEKPKQFVFFCD